MAERIETVRREGTEEQDENKKSCEELGKYFGIVKNQKYKEKTKQWEQLLHFPFILKT